MNIAGRWVDCPVCSYSDRMITVAVHLFEKHKWPFDKVMDWIRVQEAAA